MCERRDGDSPHTMGSRYAQPKSQMLKSLYGAVNHSRQSPAQHAHSFGVFCSWHFSEGTPPTGPLYYLTLSKYTYGGVSDLDILLSSDNQFS